MTGHDVLVLGLDGFDIGFANTLMDAGEMPALAALREQSATFLLDHGAAARTGLAWEHFASGMGPETGQRSSMVELVDSSYETMQRGVRFAPSFGSYDAKVVVFDPPYTDITRAPSAQGVVGWGAHDSGLVPNSIPPELRTELGPYPSSAWTYASPWPSADRTAEMSGALVNGMDTRREAARWLLTERLPDWNLAVVVAGEPHTAAEAFWHGVDPEHPLHQHPSAPIAATGLADLYRATDRMVAELIEVTSPTSTVVFSMGGMGTNNSDVPSMVLLPELVYRWATGERFFNPPDAWTRNPTAVPGLEPDQVWRTAVHACYPKEQKSWSARIRGAVPRPVRRLARRVRPRSRAATAALNLDLSWVPASRYRDEWSKMRAFALPSFYDGRIRVNLVGREPSGIVTPDEYDGVLDELETLLGETRDPRTGLPSVAQCTRTGGADPLQLDAAGADLVVRWGEPASACEHPELGVVGPVPYRRTGGHTGPHGFAFVSGDGIRARDGGVRSAFDVNPTIASLLGFEPAAGLDGENLLDERGVLDDART